MKDFVLFSYQCNPDHVEVDPTKTLLSDYEKQENQRADENMARHQELFQEFFEGEDEPNRKHGDQVFFVNHGGYYPAKIMMNQGGIIMLRLQKDKTHEYEVGYKMHSQKEQPSCMIIIDNRHEQQRVLIERSKDVFAPSTIARMMEVTIGKWMTQKYRVGLRMPLVFKKDQFWNVIEEFQNGVKKLEFDFPYPNMARPMNKLGASLKQFGVALKGKVRITTTSQPRDFLVIDPKEKNEDLDEIVSYLYDVGSPVNVYLVSGQKVKCFSKENPTIIQVHDKIANFRGEEQTNLFKDGFWEPVAEKLNELKRINYGDWVDKDPEGVK